MYLDQVEDKLTIGKVYNVDINDCCAEATFTSEFTGIEYETDDEDGEVYVSAISFKNGVRLTLTDGVSFEEVEINS